MGSDAAPSNEELVGGTTAAPPKPDFTKQQAEAAAAQSPAELQTVPEQRPQAFDGDNVVSETSTRLDSNTPATQEDYDRADSDKAKKDSIKNSRSPRLYEGQRVTFIDGPEKGRMGFVQSVVFTDAVQQMMASTGIPEARFAEVQSYIIRTRDGRSDVISAKPEEVKPLDDIEGWGRGQI